MTDEEAKRFGKYVKRLRQNNKLSVREVARRGEIDAAVVVHVESGQARHTRVETLKALAHSLQIPLADMFVMATYAAPYGAPCIATHLRVCYQELSDEALDEIDASMHRIIAKYHGAPRATNTSNTSESHTTLHAQSNST